MRPKIKLSFALVAAAALALSACSTNASTSAPASSGASGGKLSVAHMVSQALGDQSFFDDAESGVQRLKADGHTTFTQQSDANNPTQWKTNTEQLSGKYDIVIVGSSQMTDILNEVAQKYPNQKYIIYDDVVNQPNVASITFKQNEGSFLAGALAALVTTNPSKFPNATGSKVIGLVGGMDVPVIQDFVVGFKAGAEAVDPSVQVKTAFIGDFTNSQKGHDLAMSMFTNDKADVVYQVAGGAGVGILQAAKDAGRYGIGVDSNQNALQPGFILASMLKHMGNGVYTAVTAAQDGKLEYGKTTVYGLANDGVGLTFDNNNNIVPQDIQDKVKDFGKQVIDGKIKVPTTTGG